MYEHGLLTYYSGPDADIYYRKGRMHREGDLPAHIELNGTRKWYMHGQLHREGDRPAVVYPYEVSAHRLTGYEWWRHGQLHRDTDRPAICVQKDSLSLVECYYQHGLFHRESDKPAVDSDPIKVWFKRGLIHRDGKPAMIRNADKTSWWSTSGGPIDIGGWRMPFTDKRKLNAREVWAVDGNVTRGNDEPAVTHVEWWGPMSNTTRDWYIDGVIGRADDKPASCSQSPEKETMVWYTDGTIHRAGDKPAMWVRGNKRTEVFKWYERGDIHRAGDKPAVVTERNGVVETSEWYARGHLHRDGDQPAYVDRYRRRWFRHGVKHRDYDRPAEIGRDGMYWYQHGAIHRDNDRPAVVGARCGTFVDLARGNGTFVTERRAMHECNILPTDVVTCWYQHGVLHRNSELPAVICGSGAQWYWQGKLMKIGPIHKSARPVGPPSI